MAVTRATAESPYMKALAFQRRRIGDYEKVLFRTPKAETSTSATEIQGGFSSRRQPELQPQVASYSRATSKSYLKQTEALWSCMNLSRQEATSSLLDRPTGSFIVRSSSNAPYALTVRLPDSDPPVMHFLVYHNAQQHYYIQGSNLQFRTLYDLLSYYSFNQSGGMPCLLRPPKQALDSSDSEDSDDEEESSKSPLGYARKPHFYDEITPRFDSQRYQPSPSNFHWSSASPEAENGPPPPPLPPRQSRPLLTRLPHLSSGRLELRQTAQRVASYVDTDAGTLLRKLGSVKGVSEPYTKRPVQFVKPPEHRESTTSSVFSFEPTPPSRNVTNTNERGGVGRSVVSEPAPPYKNFTIIDEQKGKGMNLILEERQRMSRNLGGSEEEKRVSRNLASESPFPYKNFMILDEHETAKRNSGVEPSSPYRSPSQVFERPVHKELVQPVLGEGKPPLPPRSLPPPIPPRSIKPPPTSPPCTTPPPIPSYHTPSVRAHNAPPIPPHNAPPPLPPHTVPPPLPPKRTATNDSSPHREDRVASLTEVVQEEEVQNYGYALPDKTTVVHALPDIFPDYPLRRTSSDTSIVSHRSEISDKHKFSPTPIIGGDSLVTSNEPPVPDTTNLSNRVSGDWELVSSIPAMISPLPWYKPRRKKKTPWSKKLKWPRKPRKRLKSYIRSLAEDTEEEFGWRVHYFCTVTLMRSDDPHQNLISDIRQFITRMRESLLKDYRTELLREGMDSCRNFEHLLESSLQRCIVMPLHNFILTRLEKEFSRTGSLQQLKEAIADARSKAAEDLGLRAHLLPPQDKALQEINAVFVRLRKSYCAMKKLEYLLEAVRLTYESVRDSNNPKKPMNDLGADDFLPLFVWVLAHCGFETAEIESEYMWGLAHPSLFNGEGGYYLTTLTSAVNVLKELCSNSALGKPNTRPSLTDLQTLLEIHFEDEESGKFLRTCLLPVIPTMTSSEICDMIAEQQSIPCPEEHVLAIIIGDQVQPLADEDCPQEIHKKWELQDSVPSEKFIAYMKRAHLQGGQRHQPPPTGHEY